MTHALLLALTLIAQPPSDGVNELRQSLGCPTLIRDARLDRAAAISVADAVARTEDARRRGYRGLFAPIDAAHQVVALAAKQAGWPEGPRIPQGPHLNYTEGWGGGTLAFYLGALRQFGRTDPNEPHLVAFRNKHWTHYGWAEKDVVGGGTQCTLWLGYLPGEKSKPKPPPPVPMPKPELKPGPAKARCTCYPARDCDCVRSGRSCACPPSVAAPAPVPDQPEDPGPYDHLIATAVYLTTPAGGGGTGVIVKSVKVGSEYLNTVFTVAHVVAAGDPTVRATEGGADRQQSFAAEVVRLDRQTDAAVLRFRSPGPMPVATIDWKPRRLKVGQPIVKIGHGLMLGARTDVGIIGRLRVKTTVSSVPTIQMSIPTYGGDSGGPVFRDGKLIGLTDANQAQATTIGYALPAWAAFKPEDLD